MSDDTLVPRDPTTAGSDDSPVSAHTVASGPGPDDQNALQEQRIQALRERTGGRRSSRKSRPWWVELPILLVTAFMLTFLIQTFLFKVYYVPSGSMEQTLHGVETGGDRILVNKIIYDLRDPAPGDVIVFKGPPNWPSETNGVPGPTNWFGKFGQAVGSVVGIAPPNEKDFVKRVIAVGGQTVKCCDANGSVRVDGVSLAEPYVYEPFRFVEGTLDCSAEHLANPDRTQVSDRCFGPIDVGPGQLWMMGDHRSNSADSSYGCQRALPATNCQGTVPMDNVIGKAIFIIMPISRWDTIGDPLIDHS